MEFKDIKQTPYNPRKAWTETQAEDFKRSLAEFGDLGGVVLNKRTGHLIGGNKRTAAFAEAKDAKIETEDVNGGKPDKRGNIAFGWVRVGGDRFSYRVVSWDEKKERAANLAANKWSAEWDDGALAGMLKELDGNFDLSLTGFNHAELDAALKTIGHFDANKLTDAMGHQDVAPQSFIIYLTFRTEESMLEAMRCLTGGVRKSMPEGGRFAHIDGEGPANPAGTLTIVEALRKLL